jgi:hypothetical protein
MEILQVEMISRYTFAVHMYTLLLTPMGGVEPINDAISINA